MCATSRRFANLVVYTFFCVPGTPLPSAALPCPALNQTDWPLAWSVVVPSRIFGCTCHKQIVPIWAAPTTGGFCFWAKGIKKHYWLALWIMMGSCTNQYDPSHPSSHTPTSESVVRGYLTIWKWSSLFLGGALVRQIIFFLQYFLAIKHESSWHFSLRARLVILISEDSSHVFCAPVENLRFVMQGKSHH